MIRVHKVCTVVFCLLAASAAAVAHAQSVRFPDLGSSYLKTGDFIGPDHVQRVKPGMNKDQVRLELGNPHFGEGLFGVDEWDYAFNFYTGKGNDYVTCQLKLKFNRAGGDYRVAATHWKNPDCATFGQPPVVAAAPAPAAPAPVMAPPPAQKMVLSADSMFRFDGGEDEDLLPGGRQRINELAASLRANTAAIREVRITGHTDRLGSAAYNQALSLARARTVGAVLVREGVDPALIRTSGMGEMHPVTMECQGNAATEELIRCLQPDRRVEVEVEVMPAP